MAFAALSAAVGLAGCAALQIDVDVYKGPLVSDEDTQVQQLSSIAMSAKAMMLLKRNQWLDDAQPGWHVDLGLERTRLLQPNQWRQLQACAPQHTPAAVEETTFASPWPRKLNDRHSLCRSAAILNDVLSAYFDRVEGELAQRIQDLNASYAEYRDLRQRFAPAPGQGAAKELSKLQKQEASEKAERILRELWLAAVDLLQTAKRQQPAASPGAEGSARAQADRLVRDTAATLAQITEPALLKGVRSSLDFSAAFRSDLDSVDRALQACQTTAALARLQLALQAASAADIGALRGAADLQPPAAPVQSLRLQKLASAPPAACANAAPAAISTAVAGGPAARPGVHIPHDIDAAVSGLDTALKELEFMIGGLSAFSASGFDRGRSGIGIDRLADLAAQQRFRERSAAGFGATDAAGSTAHTGPAGAVRRLADDGSTQALHDAVVDLAGRMQFMAVNMRLLDDNHQAARTDLSFKVTLETIANTLLVLAEDQRRQRTHHQRQAQLHESEHTAASARPQLNLGQRYDQLLNLLAKAEATGAAIDNTLAQAEAAHEAAKKQVEEAKAEAEKRKPADEQQAARHQQVQALDTTLGPLLLKPDSTPVPPAPAGEPAELWAKEWQAKGQVLKGLADTTTAEGVRTALAAWLDAEKKKLLANTGLARDLRLQRAADGMEQLKTTSDQNMPRAEAVQALLQLLAQRVDQVRTEGQAQTVLQTQRQKSQAVLQQAVTDSLRLKERARSASNALLPSTQHARAAHLLLSGAREAVLAKATTPSALPDAAQLQALVLESLKADAPVQAATAGLVNNWAASPLRALLPEGPATGDSALKVLDRVQAHLNYEHISQLRSGAQADAAATAQALEALEKRRAAMAYVRPASMYLRSALTSTFQQDSATLEWRNLLVGTVTRLGEGYLQSPDKARAAEVRAELDKSFWQNVNRVRVSAGGDSNFAIAKDDVGNWYVKAMGSDPAAMVQAAKGLALYNLGGRLDSNLLRIDELRESLRTGNAESARYASETVELDGLVKGRNSPAAGAYGQTLQVFESNHGDTVGRLLTSLRADLQADNLRAALSARWTDLFGAADSRKAQALQVQLNDTQSTQLHEAARDATAPPAVQTDAAAQRSATPSARLLAGTQGLLALRAEVKRRVDQEAALLSVETATLADAKTEAERQQQAIDATQVKLDAALNELKNLGTASSSSASALADVNQQRAELAALQLKRAEQAQKVLAAEAALRGASLQRSQALAAVDEVLLKSAKAVAAQHLRAVEELETAARVVSQGVQGKTSAR